MEGVAGVEGHIRELLAFVGGHRWVWDVQVTRLFAERWWESVPVEVGVVSDVMVYSVL